MRKINLLSSLIVVGGLLAQSPATQAQLPLGSHYPNGAEGLNGANLPPPGIYLRDYNFFYSADAVDGGPKDIDVLAVVQAPRLIWITDKKILGANYGADILVPFFYKQVSSQQLGATDKFGLGDIHVEPLVLSWHLDKFDLAAGYAFWAPSGSFDASTPIHTLTSPGNGYWGHMLTLGGVWHPDAEKTWSVSLLNRYEINMKQDQTHITPGNMWTLEWGVGKSVTKSVDVGVAGYIQQQVTRDHGAGAARSEGHVIGLGPEVSVFCQKLKMFTSLRYIYEFEAKDRPYGHLVALTLTKPF